MPFYFSLALHLLQQAQSSSLLSQFRVPSTLNKAYLFELNKCFFHYRKCVLILLSLLCSWCHILLQETLRGNLEKLFLSRSFDLKHFQKGKEYILKDNNAKVGWYWHQTKPSKNPLFVIEKAPIFCLSVMFSLCYVNYVIMLYCGHIKTMSYPGKL